MKARKEIGLRADAGAGRHPRRLDGSSPQLGRVSNGPVLLARDAFIASVVAHVLRPRPPLAFPSAKPTQDPLI